MTDNNKVVIVWGGWTCNAGYMKWAYVSNALEPNPNYKGQFIDGINAYEMSRIGERIYQPEPSLKHIGKEAIEMCRKWCQENNKQVIEEVKLRTD